MSFLDIAAAATFCGMCALIAGTEHLADVLAHLRDMLAGPDRRHHISECSAREVGPPCLESFYTCEDAWALPTGEPRGW